MRVLFQEFITAKRKTSRGTKASRKERWGTGRATTNRLFHLPPWAGWTNVLRIPAREVTLPQPVRWLPVWTANICASCASLRRSFRCLLRSTAATGSRRLPHHPVHPSARIRRWNLRRVHQATRNHRHPSKDPSPECGRSTMTCTSSPDLRSSSPSPAKIRLPPWIIRYPSVPDSTRVRAPPNCPHPHWVKACSWSGFLPPNFI